MRLHQGLYLEEIEGRPTLTGVGVGVGGFIGQTEKGPIDEARIVNDWSDFVLRYGDDDGPVANAVRQYFDEGGTRAYIVRVVDDSADAAEYTANQYDLDGSDLGNDTVISALNEGSWGNDIRVAMGDYAVTAPVAIDDTTGEADFDEYDDIQVGDRLVFTIEAGPAVQVTLIVTDKSGGTVYFTPHGVAGETIAADAEGYGISANRVILKAYDATSTLSDTDSSFEVESQGALKVGDSVLLIGDSGSGNRDTAVQVDITKIEPSVSPGEPTIIHFDSISLSGDIDNVVLVSNEFNIYLYKNGSLLESLSDLSASATSERYYGTVVSSDGNNNLSDYIEMSYSDTDSEGNEIPYIPMGGALLSGGADASSIGYSEIKGSSAKPKSGIYLLDAVPDCQLLSTPGIPSKGDTSDAEAVIKLCANYCAQRMFMEYIYHVPHHDDYEYAQDIREWVQLEINLDSKFAAPYYPWEGVADGNGGIKYIPPVGGVQGAISRVLNSRGPSAVPANITLNNALQLPVNIDEDDMDILNPIGVNVIKEFRGRGIRIYGDRTQTSLRDGSQFLNTQLLMNYISQTIYEGLQPFVYKKSDPALWRSIEAVVNKFLSGLWNEGHLFPSDNESEAYYVKCDRENNPDSKRLKGEVFVEIGVNPPTPGEKVVVQIGRWVGGGRIV